MWVGSRPLWWYCFCSFGFDIPVLGSGALKKMNNKLSWSLCGLQSFVTWILTHSIRKDPGKAGCAHLKSKLQRTQLVSVDGMKQCRSKMWIWSLGLLRKLTVENCRNSHLALS